ncbi:MULTISPECIES: DUF4157 domain-containing protein [Pseudanabaena]|uniref:eCIS core domain-containing protein n=2 Tax=Pseudanabaena TaxID=1152 RepID=L8N1C4_9CYAN|nr:MULTISPECIES: DUF4157 domain-containing protein [Pseudanabaena]ELS32854.1 hypothetical protein Pse7429DRAFT_1280 [Pseudanabaena biceps PCC 7429]MDG3494905.1 DUF4157 domain-containing protein [Pseudanabaena catenata USMAC16]
MNHKSDTSSQTPSAAKNISINLQTRPFPKLATPEGGTREQEVSHSGVSYSENLLEKIIHTPTPEAIAPVQRKLKNRLQTISNQSETLQTKLNIGEPDDKYEKEADKTAKTVVEKTVVEKINKPDIQRTKLPKLSRTDLVTPMDSTLQNQPIQKQEVTEEMEIEKSQESLLGFTENPEPPPIKPREIGGNRLRRKPLLQRHENIGGGEASQNLESSIQRMRGSGQPLEPKLKLKMERAMGTDFSTVKIHTDTQSDRLNQSIQAKAFTTGQDVFFRQGAYAPTSRDGQELIAHELTHVVQQNGNKLRRSLQPLSPQPLFAQQQKKLSVQRKFNLKTSEETRLLSSDTDKKQEMVSSLVNALKTKKDALTQYEEKGKEQDIETYVNHQNLKTEIQTMLDSNIDYGEVDINNEQQLALFYFRVKKQLDPEQRKRQLETAKETGQANAQDFIDKLDEGSYEDRVKHSVGVWENGKEVEKIYNLAILGAGASAAYYIENNLNNIDLDKTILIGEEQPWRKERGAKGVINHPMNMITPKHQKGKELQDSEGGLASRRDFSDEVDKVVKQIPRKANKILSVQKQGYATKYYRIDLGSEVVYAQNVVVGLGIGKHKLPDDIAGNEQKQADIKKSENAFKENIPRVLNMDEFQRAISEETITAEEINSMVISGPNAGIDVATTAIRKNIKKVSWIVGNSGPMFLPGTDNVFAAKSQKKATKVKEENEKVKKDGEITYYQYYYNSVDVGTDGVTVHYGDGKKEDQGPPIKADLLVYALGPDAKSLRDMFTLSDGYDNKGDKIALEAVYDINQHFNRDDSENLEAQLRLYFDYYFREKKKVEESQVKPEIEKAIEIFNEVIKKIPAKPQERPEHRAFNTPIAKKLPTVLGLKARKDDKYDESSLEFMGGSAYRLAEIDETKYAYVSQSFQNLLNDDFVELEENFKTEEYSTNHLARLKQYLEFCYDLARDMEQKSKWETWDNKYYTERVQSYRETLNDMRKNNPLFSEVNVKRYKGLLTRATHHQDMLEEYFANRLKNPNEQKASTHMAKNQKTLPQNVLLSDQLTATRSTIEARQESIPSYIVEGVNLITGDQTVIASYIASALGNIPAPLADHLTSQIIFARRHMQDEEGPLPAPNVDDPNSTFNINAQNKFQKTWNDFLDKANNAFSAYD